MPRCPAGHDDLARGTQRLSLDGGVGGYGPVCREDVVLADGSTWQALSLHGEHERLVVLVRTHGEPAERVGRGRGTDDDGIQRWIAVLPLAMPIGPAADDPIAGRTGDPDEALLDGLDGPAAVYRDVFARMEYRRGEAARGHDEEHGRQQSKGRTSSARQVPGGDPTRKLMHLFVHPSGSLTGTTEERQRSRDVGSGQWLRRRRADTSHSSPVGPTGASAEDTEPAVAAGSSRPSGLFRRVGSGDLRRSAR